MVTGMVKFLGFLALCMSELVSILIDFSGVDVTSTENVKFA